MTARFIKVEAKALKRVIPDVRPVLNLGDIRHWLTCVWLKSEEGHLRAVATDGFTLVVRTVPDATLDETVDGGMVPIWGVMIKNRHFKRLLTAAAKRDEMVTIRRTAGLHFTMTCPSGELDSATVDVAKGDKATQGYLIDNDAKFCEYERVIPPDGPNSGYKGVTHYTARIRVTAEVMDDLGQVMIERKDDFPGPKMRLTIASNTATLAEHDRSRKWSLACDYTGKKFAVNLTMSYLYHCLDVCYRDGGVTMHGRGDRSADVQVIFGDANPHGPPLRFDSANVTAIMMPLGRNNH